MEQVKASFFPIIFDTVEFKGKLPSKRPSLTPTSQMAANGDNGNSKPRCEGEQRAAWHKGGNDSVMNSPLEHQATPPVTGSAGGDCYFPITCGMHMERYYNNKPIKCSNFVVQRHL